MEMKNKPLLFKGFNYFTRKQEFLPALASFYTTSYEGGTQIYVIYNQYVINQLLAQKLNGQL